MLGAVALDRLLRTKRPVPIAESDRARNRGAVRATDDQEEVARMFERYNLVVGAGGRSTASGWSACITFDDIVDVIEEEAEEDIKALGGVRSEEELSDSVWTIAKGRFNWLLVNLATAFLASSVLGLFEGQLEKMVALAVLAPIVASQGGNAATQTMTVAVRALATRELSSANAARVVLRELLVGLLNGVAFAVITGVAAAAWFKIPDLGVVIGLAMICNLVAGGARRHPHSACAAPLALRSGGLLGLVRDHRDRRRRLLLVPRHRHALVRVAVNQRSWRLPPSVVGRVADASAGRAFTASSPSCVNPTAQQFVFCAL